MTKDQAIDKAIEHLKGKPCEIGSIVAIENDPYAYELIGIEGDLVLVSRKDCIKSFNKCEIFDVNKIQKVAQVYYTLGYYNPEQEPMVLFI